MKILFLLTVLASAPSFAGDKKFLDFAKRQVTEAGVIGCEAAVEKSLGNVSGQDVRINRSVLPAFQGSAVTLTAVWGDPEDNVYQYTVITKKGGSCFVNESSTMTFSKSCTAYLAENPLFKYEAESSGTVWTKNKGGVLAVLKPFKGSCIVSMTLDTITPASGTSQASR